MSCGKNCANSSEGSMAEMAIVDVLIKISLKGLSVAPHEVFKGDSIDLQKFKYILPPYLNSQILSLHLCIHTYTLLNILLLPSWRTLYAFYAFLIVALSRISVKTINKFQQTKNFLKFVNVLRPISNGTRA